jgi:hypothetical protein
MEVTNMSGTFFKVSGIDPNDGAMIVFIWSRDGSSENDSAENYVLLGSGHVVGSAGCSLPPGAVAGQFSVTFLLPPGRAVDGIVVTDDKSSNKVLSGAIITPCFSAAGFQSGGAITSGDAAVCAGPTAAFLSAQSQRDDSNLELRSC